MGDFAEDWNSITTVGDLYIYTDLPLESLVKYFSVYQNNIIRIYNKREDGRYFAGSIYGNGDDWFPDFSLQSTDMPHSCYPTWKDITSYDFTPKSVIITDTVFEKDLSDIDLDEVLLKQKSSEHMVSLVDTYFTKIKKLRQTLNSDGIAHFVLVELIRPYDTLPKPFLIGGVSKSGEPYVPSEAMFFAHAKLFSQDEWFFRPSKRYNDV